VSLQIPGISLLDPNLPCALCGDGGPRRLSHIIPAFIFKHSSVRAPTGFLRSTFNPNQRVQDGPKDYILCGACEQKFGRYERSFAPIYKHFYEHRSEPIRYRKLDALFCLSLVWRVLSNARSHPELNHLTFGNDYSRTDSAFEAWSNALLQENNPGKFRIYWLFFDDIVGGSGLPEGINRYIFHATDFDLLANSSESFVYVHIPGMFIFGMTEDHNSAEWRDMRICFNGSTYSHRDRNMPGFIRTLISEKIAASNLAKSQINERQQRKIAEAALRDPEALIKSPLTKAYLSDKNIEEGN